MKQCFVFRFNLFLSACDEGCTRDLMAELDRLEKNISTVNITGIIPAPWNRLLKIHNETKELRELLDRMEFAEILGLENRTKEVQDMADKLMPKVSLILVVVTCSDMNFY